MPSPWEDGYILAAMNDPVGRRGIWYRLTVEEGRRVLELRGGREGDDAYTKIVEGQPLDAKGMLALEDVLNAHAWVIEESVLDVQNERRTRSPWEKLPEEVKRRGTDAALAGPPPWTCAACCQGDHDRCRIKLHFEGPMCSCEKVGH